MTLKFEPIEPEKEELIPVPCPDYERGSRMRHYNGKIEYPCSKKEECKNYNIQKCWAKIKEV